MYRSGILACKTKCDGNAGCNGFVWWEDFCCRTYTSCEVTTAGGEVNHVFSKKSGGPQTRHSLPLFRPLCLLLCCHRANGSGALTERLIFLGDGPCRDQYGKEPSHWSCQEADAATASETCESACSEATCLGFQVCEDFACAGLW